MLRRLEGAADRSARFTCAIALIDHQGKEHVFQGVMEGEIAMAPAGSNGFGYDPIFLVPQFGLTSAQLSPEQKNAVSHRGQATRKLLAFLKEHPDEERAD
jgi:XTP/dITP diphosphohydrolase